MGDWLNFSIYQKFILVIFTIVQIQMSDWLSYSIYHKLSLRWFQLSYTHTHTHTIGVGF